tara:strand:+ start:292 stop:435 length:144 start_codon:yes stop_codon:yes gene_type:complete
MMVDSTFFLAGTLEDLEYMVEEDLEYMEEDQLSRRALFVVEVVLAPL